MSAKASLFRLETSTLAALNHLSRLLGRPKNKLVNEAVSAYLQHKTSRETEIGSALLALETFREASGVAAAQNTGPDANTLDAARDFVTRVANRYSVRAALLFGSRARGTHRPDSDADVAMVLHGKRTKNSTSTQLELVDIAYQVLLERGVYIQPLLVWENEWKHPQTHSNPLLLKNIEREGIVL